MLPATRVLLRLNIALPLFVSRGTSEDRWLFAIANLSTAIAIYVFVFVLFVATYKRKDVKVWTAFILLEVFFLLRATIQTVGSWTVFHPEYEMSLLLRAVTAALGIVTAVALVRVLPMLRRIPSIADMEKEIEERLRAEQAVKAAQQQLIRESRENETKFQVLLEAAPDAILILSRSGRIEFANAQAGRLFGYARNELMGLNADVLNPERVRAEQAQLRDRIFSNLERREVNADADVWGVRKDGGEFPVELTVAPLETRDGWVFLTSIRDISERLRTEFRFRALLESAPDAMVIVDPQGSIGLSNRQTERLFGYARDEMVGQSVDLLVPQALRAGHGKHRDSFFAAPRTREMGAGLDLMAVRKDGTEFPVEISLSPLVGPDGISVTAAIRDVTERKRAASLLADKVAELRLSNQALEQFAHIASHDLQEPLRMVASYTQLLAKRYKGQLDADADEFIAYAVDGTQRMKRLIEDLLLYSRAGRGGYPEREFAAEDALNETLRNLQVLIRETGAVVTHGPLPVITAAEVPVVQVLQNLIGNAVKYRSGRIPEVHISAATHAKEWVFSVADNGIGIDSVYFDRIFLIFQRLHSRQEYEGTGIGLAICQRVLQRVGGRIWVESLLGQGSTFHFSLPRR